MKRLKWKKLLKKGVNVTWDVYYFVFCYVCFVLPRLIFVFPYLYIHYLIFSIYLFFIYYIYLHLDLYSFIYILSYVFG